MNRDFFCRDSRQKYQESCFFCSIGTALISNDMHDLVAFTYTFDNTQAVAVIPTLYSYVPGIIPGTSICFPFFPLILVAFVLFGGTACINSCIGCIPRGHKNTGIKLEGRHPTRP